jgi:hypothetical protein
MYTCMSILLLLTLVINVWLCTRLYYQVRHSLYIHIDIHTFIYVYMYVHFAAADACDQRLALHTALLPGAT